MMAWLIKLSQYNHHQMKYYYTAFQKPRGLSPRYCGDGLIEAKSVKEAKEIISFTKGCPKSRIKIEKYNPNK
jgi:hypothetical protein